MEIIDGQYQFENEIFFEVNKDIFYQVIGPIQDSTHAADKTGRRWTLWNAGRCPVGVSETDYHAMTTLYYINKKYLKR